MEDLLVGGLLPDDLLPDDLLLQIRNLSFSYEHNKTAVSNVNLKIFKGEKIAVLGSNGAGKSTFFLNINGVLTPEQGEIYYRGNRITKKTLNELRKNVGIVFQDADNQIIASTVLAEVSFGPLNLKLSKEEVRSRVDEALAFMNLADFKERPPHYLSGGEKKRVSIADIIAMKPEIFIFDEPTAALDPLNAQLLFQILKSLSEEGKTMLISTHDVDFAYRFAERIIVFYEGSIIADGTPLEVFKNDAVVKKTNLKRPAMLEVYEMLVEKGMLADDRTYPKDVKELRHLIEA